MEWKLVNDGDGEVTSYRELEEIGYYGKSLWIRGPGELVLQVDYDDVDHEAVVREALDIVHLLNIRETVRRELQL